MNNCSVYRQISCYMCSISAHRVIGTFNHFYAATKFAVGALTEGLRKELRDLKSNIKVTVSLMTAFVDRKLLSSEVCACKQAISPGLVATEFLPRVRKLENPKESIEEVFSKFGYEVHTCLHDDISYHNIKLDQIIWLTNNVDYRLILI